MSKTLIINADDFGSCHAANAAIEDLFNNGFVTTTTLMAPCPWAEDAAHRARQNPRIKVGLHITTTAEYEWYRWGPIDHSCKTLMDEQGYLYRTAAENLVHASREDMAAEMRAQYAWMVSRGLAVDHVDSHMGTVYGIAGPPYIANAFALCAEHGLNFRLPVLIDTFVPNAPPQLTAMAQMAAQQAAALHIGLPQGLFTHDHDVGPNDTYESFKTLYLAMIERCPEGVSELFLHPCIETPELKAINPQWQKRVWEHRLLRDDEVLRFIQRQGITLSTYSAAPFFA